MSSGPEMGSSCTAEHGLQARCIYIINYIAILYIYIYLYIYNHIYIGSISGNLYELYYVLRKI
jgi:hypothetical protein